MRVNNLNNESKETEKAVSRVQIPLGVSTILRLIRDVKIIANAVISTILYQSLQNGDSVAVF